MVTYGVIIGSSDDIVADDINDIEYARHIRNTINKYLSPIPSINGARVIRKEWYYESSVVCE
jgi:hypothetical protein